MTLVRRICSIVMQARTYMSSYNGQIKEPLALATNLLYFYPTLQTRWDIAAGNKVTGKITILARKKAQLIYSCRY